MPDHLLILHAGETGNSEDAARIIYRQSRWRGLPVRAMSISDYPMGKLINEKYALFICSTTGQGNEPAPLSKFWRLIMKKNLPNDCLNQLNAAVIGLGDSSYIKYNVVGKKLFKRLQSLGAKMILDLVLGDDQHDLGLWASLDPWLNTFWDKICDLIPITDTRKSNSDEDYLHGPSFRVTIVNSTDREKQFPSQTSLTFGSLISNERVTPLDHFQDVRFIKISLPEQSNLEYHPGDVAMIYPENFPDEIDKFETLLNLEPNMKLHFERIDFNFIENSGYNNLPGLLDVHTLVRKYLDIHSVPKRAFFDLLWRFSSDNLERQKLKEFSSTEGQQDLYNYCLKPKRNIVEVLQDFPHTCSKIPLDYLLDLIPCIRPRAFSIASSNAMYPNELHLLVAIVQYRTILRAKRIGLCSNYLSRAVQNDNINLTIREGEFKVPPTDPLIMVGPGTGVAPFRSIIQQRFVDKISHNVLFFGCRYSNADFYFKEEWENYQSKGHILLFTAFSRDNPSKKWYVQDEMRDNQSILSDLILNKNASILIAGSSNQMPNDVRNCIKMMLANNDDNLSEDAIEKLVLRLEATRKIQYECWS